MRWLDYIFISIAACFLLVSFLIQFPQQHEAFGFPLDDGWIHATYARNLAVLGEFSFNPGESSTGTTSFLWTVLLAAIYKLSGSILFSSFSLGIAGFLYFSFTFYQLSERVLHSRIPALAATLIAMFSGFTLWWSLSGMETILFLAFGLSALLLYSDKKYIPAAIMTALLTLTRPEGIILGIVFIADQLFSQRKENRTVRDLLIFGLISITGAVVYCSWNLLLTGHFVTTSLAGRRWLANAPMDIPLNPLFHLQTAALMTFRWFRLFAFASVPQDEILGGIAAGVLFSVVLAGIYSFSRKNFFRSKWILYSLTAIGVLLLLILVIPERSLDAFIIQSQGPNNHAIAARMIRWFESTGSGLSGKRLQIMLSAVGSVLCSLSVIPFFNKYASKQIIASSTGRINKTFGLFLCWLVVHNLMYLIFVPYQGHGGRYQTMNLLLIIWLGLMGMQFILKMHPVHAVRRKLILAYQAVVFFALLHVCLYSCSNWRQIYFATVHHINVIHVQTAKWIARYLPQDARVAAYDIGALGYYSSRYVIDLGGLINSAAIPYMWHSDVDQYMMNMHATHLAMVYLFNEANDSQSIPKRLGVLRSNQFQATPLYHAQYDSITWRHQVSVAQNAYPILIVSSLKPNLRK